MILVEGTEKSGRTRACAALTASTRLGRKLWLDLGHGTADEYAVTPGASYEVLVHDGSYGDILGQIAAARDEAAYALSAGELPLLLVVNSGTALWESIKDWANQRVRASRDNRRLLRADPFAEIGLGDAGWTEANARQARIMRLLLTFPGVVVITARGKWITPLGKDGTEDGTPFYRVDAHKSLPADATCWIRLDREAPPLIVGTRAPHLDLGDEPLALDRDWSLEWVLFDLLELVPAQTRTRDMVTARPERTPQQIADEAINATYERLGELHDEALSLEYDDVLVQNERHRDETLLSLINRFGQLRKPDASVTPDRRNRLAALWQATGTDFADATARANYVQEVTGRPVGGLNDLTNSEADRIIAQLEVYLQQSTPPDEPPADDTRQDASPEAGDTTPSDCDTYAGANA